MISQYSGVVSSRDLQRRFANIDQSGACFDFDADSEIGHVVKAIKADPRPERVRRDFHRRQARYNRGHWNYYDWISGETDARFVNVTLYIYMFLWNNISRSVKQNSHGVVHLSVGSASENSPVEVDVKSPPIAARDFTLFFLLSLTSPYVGQPCVPQCSF